MDSVRTIRRFNRSVTERVGALHDGYLGRGRALGESRALWEIGRRGVRVSALRRRLNLDSGYTSRLLRSLEAEGLISVHPDPTDRRVRFARPTQRGLGELNLLDELADEGARTLLDPLTPRQRHRLVAAMSEVDRLLVVPTAPIERVEPDSDAALSCLRRYFAELAGLFEGGFDAGQALPVDSVDLVPPRGVCLVAYGWGEPIGSGSLKPLGPGETGTGYIKRMWVAPQARGAGLGKRILRSLESWARELGYARVRLETNRALERAIAMYRNDGYREIERFNDEQYGDFFFEKSLT